MPVNWSQYKPIDGGDQGTVDWSQFKPVAKPEQDSVDWSQFKPVGGGAEEPQKFEQAAPQRLQDRINPTAGMPKYKPAADQDTDSWPTTVGKSGENAAYRIGEAIGGGIQSLGETPESGKQEAYNRINYLAENPDENSLLDKINPFSDLNQTGSLDAGLPPDAHEAYMKGDYQRARDLLRKEWGVDDQGNVAQEHGTLMSDVRDLGSVVADYWGEKAAENQPKVDPRSAKWYVSQAIEGAGSTLVPASVVSIATKNPQAGLAIMFPQVYGQAYHQSRQSGRTPKEAQQDALFNAANETLSEGIPLGILTKEGGKFGVRVFKATAAEGLQETINESVSAAYDAGVLDEKMTPNQVLRRLADAGIIGAIGGGGTALIMHPLANMERNNAETIRGDQGQAVPGVSGQAGQQDQTGQEEVLRQGPGAVGPNIQQPAQARTEAGNGQGVEPSSGSQDTFDPAARVDEQIRGSNAESAPIREPKNVEQPTTASKMDVAGTEAASSPLNDRAEPTDAQKEVGNYKKGHVSIGGLDIAIENPRGSKRSGTAPDGTQWESTLTHHYGYVKGTMGRDGDQVDVFMTSGAEDTTKPVFVIDQVDPKTRKFDEHKAILGADTEQEARDAYLSNYEDGWQGLGNIRQFTFDEFKQWLNEGNTQRRVTRSNEPQRPSLPEEVTYGPASFKPKPIGKSVFRETSADGISDLLIDSGVRNGAVKSGMPVTDNLDLALGQGNNKGVIVQFRGDGVSGDVRSKPGTSEATGQEYDVNYVGADSIDQIAYPKGTKLVLRGIAKRVLNRDFKKTTTIDGRIVWTRNGVEPATDLRNTQRISDQSNIQEVGKASSRTSPGGKQSMQPGENYTGFIRDAYTPIPGEMPKISKKPIRREEVLRPFVKALGVPLYQGRIAKNARELGYYIPNQEVIRLKKRGDLEVAAHEIAHMLDDRDPKIGKAYRNNKTYREELRGLSYDNKKIFEGFAEFVRHWMTQPDVAYGKAPKFAQWWDNYVQKSDHAEAIADARKGMRQWFLQSEIDKARSKVGDPGVSLTDVMDGWGDEFRQSIADDFHGILKMELDLTGERAPAASGIYETARLSRAGYSIVDGAMRFGYPVLKKNGSFAYEGKSLSEIFNEVGNQLDAWQMYAIGRSANELMGQGRENLFTRAEIDAMLALETPEFKQAFDDYQEWNTGIVDFAVDMGLINKQQRATWRRSQYIPFYRVGSNIKSRRSGGVEGNIKAWKALTGGTGNLNDIFENMIENASYLITESIKNDVRRRVVDFGKKQRGGGRFLTKIAKETKAISIDKEQIRRKIIASLGLNASDVESGNVPESMITAIDTMERNLEKDPDYLRFWMFGQTPKANSEEQIIAVMRDGKPEFYQVADPLLFRAFEALNPKQKNVLRRGLSASRRLIQGSVTLTLDFMTANLWRDTLSGWTYSRAGFRPVIDSVSGLKSRITQDESYREFIANAGGMASYMVDPAAFKKHMRRFYKKKGINYHTVIDTPGKLLYMFETLADSFEMATRIGEFKREMNRGESPRHAAYLAREVSTDFAMHGDSEIAGWLYDSVLFLKAGVNGLDRAFRGLTKDPNRAGIWARATTLASVSATLYLYNRSIPCYNQLEDWDKDTNWHIFIKKDDTGDCGKDYLHFRLPKIWEIGAFSSVAERAMEQIMNGLEADAKSKGVDLVKYGKDVSRIFIDLFKMDYIPGLVEPAYEVYALNENRFSGRQIETQGMQSRQPWARYNEYTSPMFKDLGEATRDLPPSLQISPERAEALYRGYTNTMGLYAMMLAEETFYERNQPARRLDQYPVLRRFYRQEPGRTKYETKFWEFYDEVAQLHNTANKMASEARPELYAEMSKKEAERVYQAVEDARQQLLAISGQMEMIYRDTDMSPDEKRKVLDELSSQKNEFLKQFVTEYEKAVE